MLRLLLFGLLLPVSMMAQLRVVQPQSITLPFRDEGRAYLADPSLIARDSLGWHFNAEGSIPFGLSSLGLIGIGSHGRISPTMTGYAHLSQFSAPGASHWNILAGGALPLGKQLTLGVGGEVQTLSVQHPETEERTRSMDFGANVSLGWKPIKSLDLWASLRGMGPRPQEDAWQGSPSRISAGGVWGRDLGLSYGFTVEVKETVFASEDAINLTGSVRLPLSASTGLMLGFETRSQSISSALSFRLEHTTIQFAFSYGAGIGSTPGFGISHRQR